MVSESMDLRPGERVITTAKLHLGAVLVPAALLLLGLIVALVDISATMNQYRVLGIVAAALGLLGTVPALLARLTTKFVMTDERLIGESGIRPHKSIAIEIRNLDSVVAKRGLLGSLLGYGTLVVDARGRGNLQVQFPQVIGASTIAEQIRAQMVGPRKTTR